MRNKSLADFSNYFAKQIEEVEKEREQADNRGENSQKVNLPEGMQVNYINTIRDYYLKEGYRVFFLRRFDIQPKRESNRVLEMQLTWW